MNDHSALLDKGPRLRFWAFAVFLATFFAHPVSANPDGGFSGGVTPSRFEITASAGDVVRRSVEIYNLGSRPAKFQVSTTDWSYSADGKIGYSQPLTENSCRPWVHLEARELDIVPDPRRPRSFRFEMHVPEDAKPFECRFALMLESIDSAYTAEFEQAGIKLPVNGRIAVIVYLAVGGVEPELVLDDMEVQSFNGLRFPVVKVTNIGAAHGRLDGDLVATEKGGRERKLSIATSPILAGQTRYMRLTPVESDKPLMFPVAVEGKIYGPKNTYAIDSVLNDP